MEEDAQTVIGTLLACLLYRRLMLQQVDIATYAVTLPRESGNQGFGKTFKALSMNKRLTADGHLFVTLGIKTSPWQTHQTYLFKSGVQRLSGSQPAHGVQPRVKDFGTPTIALKTSSGLSLSLENEHTPSRAS